VDVSFSLIGPLVDLRAGVERQLPGVSWDDIRSGMHRRQLTRICRHRAGL
jgi:hypothetical protein